MALTEEECRDIYRATQETGKQITVGFNRRYAPSYVELKKLLRRRAGPGVISCRINSQVFPVLTGWPIRPLAGLFWARLVISWT